MEQTCDSHPEFSLYGSPLNTHVEKWLLIHLFKISDKKWITGGYKAALNWCCIFWLLWSWSQRNNKLLQQFRRDLIAYWQTKKNQQNLSGVESHERRIISIETKRRSLSVGELIQFGWIKRWCSLVVCFRYWVSCFWEVLKTPVDTSASAEFDCARSTSNRYFGGWQCVR